MGDAQADLAATLRRMKNGAADKVHKHRHGTVLRVDNTRPFVDVLLDPGDEAQGVAFYGPPPSVGDPVGVLIEPDGYMEISGGRGTGSESTIIVAPGDTSPVIPFPVGLGRMTLFGNSWLMLLPPDTDTTAPTQPSGLTAENA